jgi:hypothetical protein
MLVRRPYKYWTFWSLLFPSIFRKISFSYFEGIIYTLQYTILSETKVFLSDLKETFHSRQFTQLICPNVIILSFVLFHILSVVVALS